MTLSENNFLINFGIPMISKKKKKGPMYSTWDFL